MATPALAPPIALHAGSSADLDGVMRVMEAAFGTTYGEAWTRSQCAGILPMSGVALTLARDDRDETVGFSLFRTVADDAELLLLAVHPDRHRQGIGARLLDDFIGRARALGVARVHLEVRDNNPATAMYTAHGFTAVGRRHRYYRGQNGDRFDAITLARKA